MTVYRPDPVYFPLAVRSILDQTYRDFEFLIVEDPSDRPAADLLRGVRDDRLRHVCNPARTSYLGQRNQALRLARGEIAAVIDADDVSAPTRLEGQLGVLTRDPAVTLVGTQLELIDPRGRRLGWRRYPCDHAAILAAFPRANPFAHPSVMFRREAVVAAGGYRYDRYPACEDYDLWSRLAVAGHRFANHPEPLLRYRLHPASMKATRVHGTIRGTLEVKRTYWATRMTVRDRLRAWGERALLLLPPRAVLKLFELSQTLGPGAGVKARQWGPAARSGNDPPPPVPS